MNTSVSILTQHNDNNRTGANTQETQLTVYNVNANHFGKLFAYGVDGQIYAQPLYVSGVSIPNMGLHNVVYVATMNNSVYAFDADDPNAYLLWFSGGFGGGVPLPDPNIGPHGYGDITGQIGIVSTPVISLALNTIYVVLFTKVGNEYTHVLRAINLATGKDNIGPVVIQGSVPGNGDGSVNGRITFTSNRQIQRAGLLLANNVLYIAFASYGDQGPYHGWVFAYNATTLQQLAIYNTTPNGGLGGIWQAGQGLAADSANNVYCLTGNGSFSSDGSMLGDSFIKLTPNLALADWFSPYDNTYLKNNDLDLGSGGAMLIPNTSLVFGGGKEGKVYLVNTQNMGKFNSNNDNQIVQSLYVSQGNEIHGGPVYWQGPGTTLIFLWPEGDCLKGYTLLSGQPEPTLMTTPSCKGSITGTGSVISLSANGSAYDTGIVWVLQDNTGGSGILRAYDAWGAAKIWDSEVFSAADHLPTHAKFCPPTIANGKVYVATFSNELVVYGLLPVVTIGQNPDGRLEAFRIGTDHKVIHNWQNTPGGGWSGWDWLGPELQANRLVVGQNATQVNPLEVFALGTDSFIYHINQAGGWPSWSQIPGGGQGRDLTVARNADGRLELFVIGTDNQIWHNWQTSPDTDTWSGWNLLGPNLAVQRMVVGQNASMVNGQLVPGPLEVFALGVGGGTVYRNTQTGNWPTWSKMQGWQGTELAVAGNSDGRLELFLIGTDSQVWHTWQASADTDSWSNWYVVGPSGMQVRNLTVAQNASVVNGQLVVGPLEVFALGGNNGYIYHNIQTGNWPSWSQIPGGWQVKSVSVGRNADGRLELFAVGTDNQVWHNWQTTPDTDNWSGWEVL